MLYITVEGGRTMRLAKIAMLLAALMLLIASTSAIAGGNNPQQRPFWGNFSGEATFPSSEDCGITQVPFQTLSNTEGMMTHMGRSEMFTSHCATPDGSAAVGGMATLVAANGDEVSLTYSATTVAGPPVSPVIIQVAEFIIVGGTGRFEGASGMLTGMVYITFEGFDDPAWPIEFVVAGTIVY